MKSSPLRRAHQMCFALIAGGLLTAAVPVTLPGAHAQERCAIPLLAPPPPPSDAFNDVHRLAQGGGVRVAVIDTGVANHPELRGVIPGADILDPENPRPLEDCTGHGTIVAGVIGSSTYGVAPRSEIISIRQSGQSGTIDGLTAAIHNAVDLGARVINVSVVACMPRGEGFDATALDEAINRAEVSGALIVAAAGNASSQCTADSAVIPAHHPLVVAVGSSEEPYVHEDYSIPIPSNHPVRLSAPGTVSVGLSPSGEGFASGMVSSPGSPAAPFVGTSFAAPVVSGTVALMLERRPTMSPEEIRSALRSVAHPTTGRMLIDDAVNEALHTPLSATALRVPPPVTPEPPAYMWRSLALGVTVLVGATLGCMIAALIHRIRRKPNR